MQTLPKWALLNPLPAIYDFESVTPLQQTARVYGAMQEMIREYNAFADQLNKEIESFTGSSEEEIKNFKESVENRIRCKFKDMDATFAKIKSDLVTHINDYLASVPALPVVNTSNNDQVMKVINGAWNAVKLVDKTLSFSGMAADAAEVGLIRTRLNNIAQLSEGSTSGDAELIDARTDYTGKTWENVGEHIRCVTGKLSEHNDYLFNNAPFMKIEYWNLLNYESFESVKEKAFINDGVETANNSYYTYMFIPVEPNTYYYVYDPEYVSGKIRFVNYYTEHKEYISFEAEILNFTTPENAKYVCLTCHYVNGTFDKGEVYITKTKDHVDRKVTFIPNGFRLPAENISGLNADELAKAEHRIATINFQFDDGHHNDTLIYDIFRNKNATCGFALLSTIPEERIDEYLTYQANGFEILAHSTDGDKMGDDTQEIEDIEYKFKTSKKTLSEYGFNIRGWVTPSSSLNDKYVQSLRKYYDFGATLYYGNYYGQNEPSQNKETDTMKLWRVSINSTTLEKMKEAVDRAIENNGFLTFYSHSLDLDGEGQLSTSNINSLLDYINEKQAELKCYLLKPSEAIDYYFHVRHSDYLELMNKQ